MELWIRTQSKNALIKCNGLIIKECKNRKYRYGDIDLPDEYSIVDNSQNLGILGIYKTEERALEVLDEIQDILDAKKSYEKFAHLFTKDTKIIEFSNVIYEMPK